VFHLEFPEGLQLKIENNEEDGYVTHLPTFHFTKDFLEIGHAILKIVEKDDDYFMTLIISAITSPVAYDCEIEKSFHDNYLRPSTGLSGVQWWRQIEALEKVKHLLDQPQLLSRTQTKDGIQYWSSVQVLVRTIL
jgi:hypothetical protein